MAAGNATVGALRIVLGADTGSLEDGLKRASSSLDSFASGFKNSLAGLSIGVVAGAFALSIKHMIDEADKLGKSAQKFGIPVEELSKLSLAAKLSDVSMESLGVSLGKLSKSMAAMAAGGSEEVKRAFQSIGVSATDASGKLRPTQDVLGDIAEAFSKYEDGAAKTALAIQIFGKAGAAMIPLLNGGRDGLKEAADEAERFGIVIDKKTAKSAEAFNDNLTRMGAIKDGIILKITQGMLPAFENLTNSMIRTAKDGDGLNAWGRSIGETFVAIFHSIERLGLAFTRIGVEWKALREFLNTDIFSGKVIENWNKFTAAGEETKRMLDNLKVVQDTAHLLDAFGGAVGRAADNTKKLTLTVPAAKNAIDEFLSSQVKSQAALQAEIATFGLSAGARERLTLVMQAGALAKEKDLAMSEAQRAKMVELGFALENYKLQLSGLNLVHQNTAPLVLWREELANTETAMRSVGATAEQLARNQEAVGAKFGMTWSAIGANIAGTAGALSQLTGTFAKENKAMGIASKAFGIGQAIINTQIAITKALATLPPPASYAAVALAVAQGAAAVASISMQKFAMGGSFQVPGGIGGGDKVFTPMMLEPGELVEVSSNRADGYRGGDSRGGGSWTINATTDDISRPIIEKFIRGLNEAFGDGHFLKLAAA